MGPSATWSRPGSGGTRLESSIPSPVSSWRKGGRGWVVRALRQIQSPPGEVGAGEWSDPRTQYPFINSPLYPAALSSSLWAGKGMGAKLITTHMHTNRAREEGKRPTPSPSRLAWSGEPAWVFHRSSDVDSSVSRRTTAINSSSINCQTCHLLLVYPGFACVHWICMALQCLEGGEYLWPCVTGGRDFPGEYASSGPSRITNDLSVSCLPRCLEGVSLGTHALAISAP